MNATRPKLPETCADIDMQEVHSGPSAFRAAIANYFTCSNLGGMVANWYELAEDGESAEYVREEHRAWDRVAIAIVKVCEKEKLPFSLENAEAIWQTPKNKLGAVYEGKKS